MAPWDPGDCSPCVYRNEGVLPKVFILRIAPSWTFILFSLLKGGVRVSLGRGKRHTVPPILPKDLSPSGAGLPEDWPAPHTLLLCPVITGDSVQRVSEKQTMS